MLYETDWPLFWSSLCVDFRKPLLLRLAWFIPGAGGPNDDGVRNCSSLAAIFALEIFEWGGGNKCFFFLAWAGGSQSLFGKATRVIVRLVEN